MQDNMEYLIQNEQGSQKKKSDEGSSTPTRCVWNLLTIFVVLNTMISIALLGITIAFVTRVTKTVETSAQGIVPGTIFPSLIAAAQANLDPKSWKEIFDSSAKVLNTIKKVDWSIDEKIKYNENTPAKTCYEQENYHDCKGFGPVCNLNIACAKNKPFLAGKHETAVSNDCINAGGVCKGLECCKSCQWDYTTDKCFGTAEINGSGVTEVMITEASSDNIDRVCTGIYNGVTKASNDLGDLAALNVHSPLDVTKFIKDILSVDFKKLSSQCQSIASKCAETDWS